MATRESVTTLSSEEIIYTAFGHGHAEIGNNKHGVYMNSYSRGIRNRFSKMQLRSYRASTTYVFSLP